MAQVNRPNTYSANTTISSSQVNDDFDTIYDEFNGNISEANLADSAVTEDKIANTAVTTTKIADLGVTSGKLQMQAWQSWTPTLSGRFNNTKWNKDCTYIQIGKTVFFKIRLIANNATPMDGGTAEATFTLPVTSIDYTTALGVAAADMPLLSGQVRILDSGTAALYGTVEWTTTTTAKFRVSGAGGTYVAPASFTSSVPFTWTTNDEIFALGFYEAA